MPNGASWLSKGVESLRERLRDTRAQRWDCDVLVIGSGYGGAVAAARLAGRHINGRPAEVWVLERGREWLPGTFPSRFAELAADVRFSGQDGGVPRGNPLGLYDIRLGPDVNLLLGNGLGGGSLINAAVMEEPAPAVFEHGWPVGVNAASMAPHFDAAREMLQARDVFVDMGPRPRKLVALDQLARHWGNKGAVARSVHLAVSKGTVRTPAGVDRRPCNGCGDCVTGCNWQAKNSLDVNYLAIARQRGASLFTGALAVALRKTFNGETIWEVDGVPTQPPPGTTAEAARFVVRARRLIVAAGSLGSTELLLHSRSERLGFSPRLGERFSTNGDAIHGAVDHPLDTGISASDATPAAQRQIGPTITGMLTHSRNAQDFVVQEFGIPAPLRRVLAEVTSTFGLLPRFGAQSVGNLSEDPIAAGDSAIAHAMIYGTLGDDGAGGCIVAVGDSSVGHDARVRVSWADARNHAIFRAQFDALAEIPPALAGVAVANPSWQPLPFGYLPKGPTTTVHPLGGCPMSARVGLGVVDHCGRVFDPDAGTTGIHDGLAVLDGSIVPRALAINPALTIAALAERSVATLSSDWGLDEPPPWLYPPAPLTQPRWQEPRVASGAGTGVRFEETLEGRLVISGTRYWARLELRFDVVPDLLKFISARSRKMTVQDGRLLLYPDRTAQDEPSYSASSTVPDPISELALDGEMHVLPPGDDLLGGKERHIEYSLTVSGARPDSPLPKDTRLLGLKKLFVDDEKRNGPLRQLSVMALRIGDANSAQIGELEVDLGDFARRHSPLLTLQAQEDQPTALADLGAFLLFMFRMIFCIHARDLMLLGDQPMMTHTRKPEALAGLEHAWFALRAEGHEQGALGLTRYEGAAASARTRAVLLVHGLSAGGSTFAHRSIPTNLVQALCESGRVAWVLELRTSNVFDKRQLRDWTLEQVAEDIGIALEFVHSRGGGKVDVVAHCIGAAIFCLAALGDQSIGERVGAAVFSQVAPVMRLSPLNRLRGYVASYLEQYLGTALLDTRPDGAGVGQTLIDALLAAFPYPEGDGEADRYEQISEKSPGKDVDFRKVRHRADAMFGQLFELANVGEDALAALDAFFGAVRVKTLAQAIQYARWGLLADAGGRNRLVSRQNIANRMAFPVLFLHGRRNRVFDWRGSREAYQLFGEVFDDAAVDDGEPSPGNLHLGRGTSRQLLVLQDYGHQDTLIGDKAARDVFPSIIEFLDAQANAAGARLVRGSTVVAQLPWTGPFLGWLRGNGNSEVTVSLQVHPLPSRTRTLALAFVLLSPARDGRLEPQLPPLGFHYSVGANGQMQDLGDTLAHDALDFTFDPSRIAAGNRVLVLTLHDDLPRRVGEGPFALQIELLRLLQPPGQSYIDAVAEFLCVEPPSDDDLTMASFSLGSRVLHGKDAGAVGKTPAAGAFVVASCQYPPGLLDGAVADSTWARLGRQLEDSSRTAPQWLLLLGDQVYVDETAGVFDPAPDDHVVEWAYERTWRLPSLRRVRSRLPTVCMIDDHEVANDWQPSVPVSADEQRALDAYRSWQACLNPPHLAPGSRSFAFVPGGWPVFVLDTRTKRQRRGPDGVPTAQARLIDPADWQALATWLASLPSKLLKFVACPTVLLPLERQAMSLGVSERLSADSGSGYPRTQLDLLTLIRDHSIENVVLLAGDIHLSLACTFEIAGGPRVHSIVSSGLYAPWPFANERQDSFVLDGPVTFTDGERVVAGKMIRHAVWPIDGYVVVRMAQRPMQSLHVEFHDAAGGCETVSML